MTAFSISSPAGFVGKDLIGEPLSGASTTELFDLGRPVQLTHTEYHTHTRRLSGSIAVAHAHSTVEEDSQGTQKVYVRATTDGGRTFQDYEAHRLFEGFESPEGGMHQDFFAFSIRLSRAHLRQRLPVTLQRQRSNSAPTKVQFMIVCGAADDSEHCFVDDNDGALYSVTVDD